MKTVFVLALAGLLLIGCGGDTSSQTAVSPAGTMLKAAWGVSRDSVKAVFAAEGLQLVSDSTELVYTGGSFEGFAADQWTFTFSDAGAFSSATVVLAPDTAGSAVTVKGLETHLTTSFGEPTAPMMWKNPKGDHATTYTINVADGSHVVLRIEGPVQDMDPAASTVSE